MSVPRPVDERGQGCCFGALVVLWWQRVRLATFSPRGDGEPPKALEDDLFIIIITTTITTILPSLSFLSLSLSHFSSYPHLSSPSILNPPFLSRDHPYICLSLSLSLVLYLLSVVLSLRILGNRLFEAPSPRPTLRSHPTAPALLHHTIPSPSPLQRTCTLLLRLALRSIESIQASPAAIFQLLLSHSGSCLASLPRALELNTAPSKSFLTVSTIG